MAADRIEVTEQGDIERRIRLLDVFEDPLDHDFRLTIRVGRAPDGIAFHKRYPFRDAIDRRGRGEDEVIDPVFPHHIKDVEGASEVILIILNRLRDAFADGFVAREMDDRVDLVFFEDLFGVRFLRHVDLIELRPNMSEGFNPIEHGLLRVIKIVDHDRLITRLNEGDDGLTSDEAQTSRNQDGMHNLLLLLFIIIHRRSLLLRFFFFRGR